MRVEKTEDVVIGRAREFAREHLCGLERRDSLTAPLHIETVMELGTRLLGAREQRYVVAAALALQVVRGFPGEWNSDSVAAICGDPLIAPIVHEVVALEALEDVEQRLAELGQQWEQLLKSRTVSVLTVEALLRIKDARKTGFDGPTRSQLFKLSKWCNGVGMRVRGLKTVPHALELFEQGIVFAVDLVCPLSTRPAVQHVV